MYMTQKAKKRSKLRHAEYYDMQNIFDELYAKSKDGEIFNNLVEIIAAPNNIMLAFRNIKSNDGSHTAGTDGRTIESLADMPEEDFVSLIQKQFTRYVPKTVRRVEIPKPNGKFRPLGIPCIIDRIVQQCILQVMEPICEAKFYEHSYGFRPCRSAENAVSYAYGLAQRNKLHYVVDVDIKGFFDNVNHRKLLQQIWTLGIRDTKLIQIIKAMLKAPIQMPDGEISYPDRGTPQGGILSPLLANIVLNELDWWIASQWEGMADHMKSPCKVTYYPNYYCIATRINLNFSRMAHVNNGRFLHRIDGYKKQGELNNKYFKNRYGKSKQMRWIGDTPVVPLAYVQFKIPMRKSRKINPYTPDGRMEIHSNLKLNVEDMLWLMRHPVTGETVQFNDNRISLYAGQEGKCAITGEHLEVIHCICYRKSNECKNGRDSYRNLLLLSPTGYELISTTDSIKFATLTKKYDLNKAQITKVNKLRVAAGLAEMSMQIVTN